MVGIDVVHMSWAGKRRGAPGYQHRGYLSRISDAVERDWVLAAVRPDAALWQLWAAKEAAYKALAPAENGRPFRPAEIAVRWRAHRPAYFGEAQWGDARASIMARSEGTCAYAVAVRMGRPPIAIEHGIFPAHEMLALPENTDVGPAGESEAGRRAAEYVLRLIGIENAVIARADGGRPYVKAHPRVSVSWSHDGEWVAAIAADEGEVQ